MQRVSIRTVAAEGVGMRVFPDLATNSDYDAIDRAALSVRWDPTERSLYVVPWPDCTPVQAFRQILLAVEQEYGDSLVLDSETAWVDVLPETRQAILALLDRPG